MIDFVKMRNLFIKIGQLWYNPKLSNHEGEEIREFNNKEALLIRLEQATKLLLLKKEQRRRKPLLIIIDGVDGVGKSTIVEKLIMKFKSEGLKVVFNTFKRRRNDDPRFRKPSLKYEWLFRKQVVEEINRRMVTYKDEDIIILDKSPYCEYFYQRTQSFDRGFITPFGNYKMEEEIFKYKELIDNAVVIFLENPQCWENYYKRENKKNDGGHKASYETLKEHEYMDMVKMFKDHQRIYENKNKYKAVEIHNDDKSWKKVYNEILKIIKENEF